MKARVVQVGRLSPAGSTLWHTSSLPLTVLISRRALANWTRNCALCTTTYTGSRWGSGPASSEVIQNVRDLIIPFSHTIYIWMLFYYLHYISHAAPCNARIDFPTSKPWTCDFVDTSASAASSSSFVYRLLCCPLLLLTLCEHILHFIYYYVLLCKWDSPCEARVNYLYLSKSYRECVPPPSFVVLPNILKIRLWYIVSSL